MAHALASAFARRAPVASPSVGRHLLLRGAATVAYLQTAHPGDVASLATWLDANPTAVPRCVLGKTEGNGCVNDFTRGYASHVVASALGQRGEDTSIIMSGGTEGVLTPHFLCFATDESAPPAALTPPAERGPRLVMGVARTRVLAPHEIGRRAQVEATRDAVLAACNKAGLAPSECCFAQVKCPLLTPDRVRQSSEPCATEDGYVSMGMSRGASALGVALATGEIEASDFAMACDGVCVDLSYSSSVASASAGIELMHAEVFVLGNARGSSSPLRAAACVMRDALDTPSVARMLTEDAGLSMAHGQLTADSRRRVRAVLAKADPVASVRGQRTTMCSDSDLHATRHARASVGGLLAGLIGDTRLYVSGGAEHQGPAGGGPCCVVYEAEPC